jgi:hypothetical protein
MRHARLEPREKRTPGRGQSGHFHSLGGAPDATLNKTLLPAHRRARRSPLPPRPVEPRKLTVIEGEIFRKPMPENDENAVAHFSKRSHS